MVLVTNYPKITFYNELCCSLEVPFWSYVYASDILSCHIDNAIGTNYYSALLATIAVFLPGFLLLLGGIQKNWQAIANAAIGCWRLHLPRVMNAAVVGLLLAALYQPIFTSAVSGGLNFALIIMGCVAIENGQDANRRACRHVYAIRRSYWLLTKDLTEAS